MMAKLGEVLVATPDVAQTPSVPQPSTSPRTGARPSPALTDKIAGHFCARRMTIVRHRTGRLTAKATESVLSTVHNIIGVDIYDLRCSRSRACLNRPRSGGHLASIEPSAESLHPCRTRGVQRPGCSRRPKRSQRRGCDCRAVLVGALITELGIVLTEIGSRFWLHQSCCGPTRPQKCSCR